MRINYCMICGRKVALINGRSPNYCKYCGFHFGKCLKLLNTLGFCTICHKPLTSRFKTIECGFCDSKFHESCILPWLNAHNACPMCQNVYLHPKEIIK